MPVMLACMLLYRWEYNNLDSIPKHGETLLMSTKIKQGRRGVFTRNETISLGIESVTSGATLKEDVRLVTWPVSTFKKGP